MEEQLEQLTNEHLIDRMYNDLKIFQSSRLMYSPKWVWQRFIRV